MTMPQLAAEIAPGFQDEVVEAQASFRTLLQALSRPGRINRFASELSSPSGLSPAITAAVLALCDAETRIWFDPRSRTDAALAFVRFHCGSPVVDEPADAEFAVIADALSMPSLDSFDHGDDLYPDRSATLLVEVAALRGGPAVDCSGPGIRTTEPIAPQGLPADFWEQWHMNHMLYPTGVDVFLTCGTEIIGLPRSTKVN